MALHKGDKSAAFLGLILGAAILGATMFGIVQWTNSLFAGHAAQPAGAAGAAAPAGH